MQNLSRELSRELSRVLNLSRELFRVVRAGFGVSRICPGNCQGFCVQDSSLEPVLQVCLSTFQGAAQHKDPGPRYST